MLLNMQMATTSPPFGLNLFVMKGVAPAGTTMRDIYRSALPFLACDTTALLLILFFSRRWSCGYRRRWAVEQWTDSGLRVAVDVGGTFTDVNSE